jgi:N-ethylmaleimide reductase
METYGAYVDALSELGLLYIHDIEGMTQQTREASSGVSFAALRKRFKGTCVANNQYTLELAAKTLSAGMPILTWCNVLLEGDCQG